MHTQSLFLYLFSIDDLEAQNRPLLRTFLMQLEIAKRFREDFLDLFGQEISLGGHTNVLIARTTLLTTCDGHASITAMFRRFRAISLTPLPLPIKIRLGLAQRGVSDKGLCLFLLIVVDRFMQVCSSLQGIYLSQK